MVPGTLEPGVDDNIRKVFALITENDFRGLDWFLKSHRDINVIGVEEARQYSLLAFCAFKNHTTCFKSIIWHAMQNNLP
jgi:hypothetical protein